MTCEKVNSNNCKVMVRAQGKEKELEKSAPIKNRILLLFFLLVLVLIISIYYYYYYYGSYLLLLFIIIIDWGIFDFRLHFTSSKRWGEGQNKCSFLSLLIPIFARGSWLGLSKAINLVVCVIKSEWENYQFLTRKLDKESMIKKLAPKRIRSRTPVLFAGTPSKVGKFCFTISKYAIHAPPERIEVLKRTNPRPSSPNGTAARV